MNFADKPGRQTALLAAHSDRSQLFPKGSFHWDIPLQKACPHCARRHTGGLGEIMGEESHLKTLHTHGALTQVISLVLDD